MPNYILAVFDKERIAPQIVHTAVPGFAYIQPEDCTAEGEVNFSHLEQKYGLGNPEALFTLFGYNKDGTADKDYFPWKEIYFSTADPLVIQSEYGARVQVTGQRLDSYTIQAIRRRAVPVRGTRTDNSIQGILVKDGKFLMGERGGTELVGTLQPVPGGGVGWKSSYNTDPITDAFHLEAYEEAGTTEIKNARLYGIFNQVTQHINRQWLFKGEPEQSIDALVDKMHAGIIFYQKQLAAGKTGREAKRALRESVHPVDAWENADAWSFSYDGEALLRLLSDGKWVNPQGKSLNLIGSLPADLYIAGVVDFGAGFKKEAEKLDFVKNEVVDQTQRRS